MYLLHLKFHQYSRIIMATNYFPCDFLLFDDKLEGKKFAIWGLSFKPKTDDMRGAPSLTIISNLLESGAKVECYDPVVSKDKENFQIQDESLKIGLDPYEIVKGADCLIICTDQQL